MYTVSLLFIVARNFLGGRSEKVSNQVHYIIQQNSWFINLTQYSFRRYAVKALCEGFAVMKEWNNSDIGGAAR